MNYQSKWEQFRPQFIAWRAEKISASEMARRLFDEFGFTASRNAVCGAMFRMGLSDAKSEYRYVRCVGERVSRVVSLKRPSVGPTVPNPRRRVKKADTRDHAFTPLPTSELVSLLDARPHHCRWPVGDEPFLFCGAERHDHSSYCREHMQRSCAYTLPEMEDAA